MCHFSSARWTAVFCLKNAGVHVSRGIPTGIKITILHKQVFDGWPSFRAKGLRRAPPNLHFATCLDARPARSLQRVARAQNKFTFHHMFGRSKMFETHDLRRRLLRAKKFRISPHHMFAHPTRTISAEGCPRTNKTRISPHVWVSDTPQRVTFRKPPPGCRCRQRDTGEVWFCRSSHTIWSPGS